MAACMNHDTRFINIGKIVDGMQDEEKVIMKQLAINYQLIKDIFTLLQSRSRTYPFVDTFAYRQYFIRDLGVLDDTFYKIANFDLILNEVAASHNQFGGDGIKIPQGSFCRY